MPEVGFNCPRCNESFLYGWPCPYEFILFMLNKVIFRCGKCGLIIVSNKKITDMSMQEVEKLVGEYTNAL